MRLTKELLTFLYVESGKSDNEIAEMLGMHRTAIYYARKKHGIKTRKTPLFIDGKDYVIKTLQDKGHTVKDMMLKHTKDITYNILIDDYIRADIKTSKVHGNNGNERYTFKLSDSIKSQNKVSEFRISLGNGYTRKDYRRICHFLIFVGFNKGYKDTFIIPSNYIPDERAMVSIPVDLNSKYCQFHENWRLIEKLKEQHSNRLLVES